MMIIFFGLSPHFANLKIGDPPERLGAESMRLVLKRALWAFQTFLKDIIIEKNFSSKEDIVLILYSI